MAGFDCAGAQPDESMDACRLGNTFTRYVRSDGDLLLVPVSPNVPRTTYVLCDDESDPAGRCLARTTLDDGLIVEYDFGAGRIDHFMALDAAVRAFVTANITSDSST